MFNQLICVLFSKLFTPMDISSIFFEREDAYKISENHGLLWVSGFLKWKRLLLVLLRSPRHIMIGIHSICPSISCVSIYSITGCAVDPSHVGEVTSVWKLVAAHLLTRFLILSSK